MSGSRHGSWRYLFVPQPKFEKAMRAGVNTLEDLNAAVAVEPASRQLQLISLDDARVEKQKFKTLLPLYSLKAAAGYFGEGEAVEPEAWIDASSIGRLDDQMFIARAVGRSMEPQIHDGDYCVFRANPKGTRQGKIVLVQHREISDPETGGSYTIKRYRSEKASKDDGWGHRVIYLEPKNSDYSTIVLTPETEGELLLVAEFISIM
jgi:SOS-response transcriptional repressor LexA